MDNETKQLAAEIKLKLLENPHWVIRALVVLHDHQTEDERDARFTHYHNKVGFSACDAEILSSYAEQVKRWQASDDHRKYRSPLSGKQFKIAQSRILKYSGQLARVVIAKRAQEQVCAG